MAFPVGPTNGQVYTAASGVKYIYDSATTVWQIYISNADGNTLYGTTAPVAGTGVDGDYYLNTTTNLWYGPKAAGAWPATTALIGSDFYSGALTSGTGASYVLTTTPDMNDAGPRDGATLITEFHAVNTISAPTLTVSGGTTRTIVSSSGSALGLGDLAINCKMLLIYELASTRWRAVFNLTAGKPVGAAYVVGDGNVIYGAGAPIAANGVDGDYWFATTTNTWYGPKAAGAWPAASTTIGCDFYNGGTTAGTGAAYTATTMPYITGAFRNGAVLVLSIHTTSTSTTPSLVCNGGTGYNIRNVADAALAVGDLVAGHKVALVFNGATSRWNTLLNLTTGAPVGSGSSATGNVIHGTAAPTAANGIDGDWWLDTATNLWYGPKAAGAWPASTATVGVDFYNLGTTAGSSTAYTATSTPSMASGGPRDGAIAIVSVHATSTSTTPTLAVNGGTARTIRDGSGGALAVGALIATHVVMLRYNLSTTRWYAVLDMTTGTPVGIASSNFTVGATAPVSPASGDEWWDTTNEVLFKYISGAWVDISSSAGGGGSFDINALPSEVTLDVANDTIPFYDASEGAANKVTISGLMSAAGAGIPSVWNGIGSLVIGAMDISASAAPLIGTSVPGVAGTASGYGTISITANSGQMAAIIPMGPPSSGMYASGVGGGSWRFLGGFKEASLTVNSEGPACIGLFQRIA